MTDFAFNIAKGRTVEFYERVKANDPSTSALVLVPLSASGTEAQGQDYDDLAALIGDANFDEQTGGGWVRKILTDAELAAFPAPDDANNRYGVAVPAVTWTAPTAGSNTTGLVICYDADTGAGTDANLIPVTHHTFAVTADGNDIVLSVGDFLRAS
jgi:hypothetical protein